MTDAHTFRCGSRDHTPSYPGMPEHDHWRSMPDGTRTCSFCGSLHEDDFIDILRHYVAGDQGYSFSTTTKGYKWYAHRPSVKNASDGGIKFYNWHVDRSDEGALIERSYIVSEAMNRLSEEMKARFG